MSDGPLCDNIFYIIEKTKTLAGFRNLVLERNQYLQQKKWNWLKTWVIRGKFLLNGLDGDLYRLTFTPAIPENLVDEIPDVAIYDDLARHLHYSGFKDFTTSIKEVVLPNPSDSCPVCKQSWTIENCHDYFQSYREHQIDLTLYAGLTLQTALEDLKERRKQGQMEFDFLLGNHVYRSDKTCLVSVAESYRFNLMFGDVIFAGNYFYCHGNCLPLDK